MLPYRAGEKDGKYILGDLEELIVTLEDHQMGLNAMLASKDVALILEQVDSWQKRLSLFADTIDEWVGVQRDWMYLENIFSAEDICTQLPDEARKFQNVDADWNSTMRSISLDPRALVCISEDKFGAPDKLLSLMRANKHVLEDVQKSLEAYLRVKREAFPRFYFLSNDELLEILAQATRNPQAVEKHLRKCFDAIGKLRFESQASFDENAKPDITAMYSTDGETVDFTAPVQALGGVERWLLAIESMMRITLCDRTGIALADYPRDDSGDRSSWLKAGHPAQCVLLVDQMMWTQGATAALRKLDLAHTSSSRSDSEVQVNPLSDFAKFSDRQIKGMVKMVRERDIPKALRRTLGTLLTLDVHAKDTIDDLAKQSDEVGVDHFDWQKQMRFYWISAREEGDEGGSSESASAGVSVRQANARFKYGFEYMGISFRLVVTPLTDKIYLTLTGALQIKNGGAPSGPAGTGKTETTKDLAKSMGRQCVVFNCQEGMDSKFMGQFFSGLASGGAWACFDEFNRIGIEVLSVIAQQVQTIQRGLINEQTRFDFEGSEIALSPNFGVFITMNPGYAGRTELPDNLKALFRPVACMVPDYRLIAEIILFSQGFDGASNLALKMTQLYTLSSEQLSSQSHYDFGMRAVKSVLMMAGRLKMQEPNTPENVLLIRALRDSNAPKFLSHDLPLFSRIIVDLFPGVTVPFVDYGELQAEIESDLRSRGLQTVTTFVNKVIQVHETMLVRHGMMLVGEAGSGKSTNLKTLGAALSSLHKKGVKDPDNYFRPVDQYVLNPKSVSVDELYGRYNELTQEWKNGIVATLVRQTVESDGNGRRKWVVFDGPVDTLWIESMNTVLDDNKVLCLSSGERLNVSADVHMVFEVLDLDQASPATVSRCGMVYMEQVHVGLDALIDTWNGTRRDRYKWRPKPKTPKVALKKKKKNMKKEETKELESLDATESVGDIDGSQTVDNKKHGENDEFEGTGGQENNEEGDSDENDDEDDASSAYEDEDEDDDGYDDNDQKENLQENNAAGVVDIVEIQEEDEKSRERRNFMDEGMDRIVGVLKRHLKPMLKFVRSNCPCTWPVSDYQFTSSILRLLDALLDKQPELLAEAALSASAAAALDNTIVWSIVWSVGAALPNENSRRIFSDFLIKRLQEHESMLSLFNSSGASMNASTGESSVTEAKESDSTKPVKLTLFDYYLNWKSGLLEPWTSQVESFEYNAGLPFAALFVPTVESTRVSVVMDLLIRTPRRNPEEVDSLTGRHWGHRGESSSILLVGTSGVGKSVMARRFLAKLSSQFGDDFESTEIALSAQTSSHILQSVFENKLEKLRKTLLGPSRGRRMCLFVDDLNMPKPDEYGSQPPLELLRQVIDNGGFYDRKKLFFKNIERVSYVTACGPSGGGRHAISERISRHLHTIWVPEPPESALQTIYQSIFGGYIATELPELEAVEGAHRSAFSSLITRSSIAVYHAVKDRLRPTPNKSHYTFNTRDISKVFQGILMVTRSHIWDIKKTPIATIFEDGEAGSSEPVGESESEKANTVRFSVLRLWLHEQCRVIYDRLIDNHDQEWFSALCSRSTRETFGDVGTTLFPVDPAKETAEIAAQTKLASASAPRDTTSSAKRFLEGIMFASLSGCDDDPDYREHAARTEGDINHLGDELMSQLDEFKVMGAGGGKDKPGAAIVDLVFFRDAVAHVARMTRILMQPRGNALLVGVGGSGRKSLARLASFMSGSAIRSIEVTSSYGMVEWREDVKSILMMAGLGKRPLCFMIDDTQVVQESFLEDINSILTSGEVLNIYESEDIEKIVSEARAGAEAATGGSCGREQVLNHYRRTVRDRLHIIMTFSPIGNLFRQRMLQFPSFSNCCTVDWFHRWPQTALLSVARRIFHQRAHDIGGASNVEPVSRVCMTIHASVELESASFLQTMGRYNYTTPTSYLELLKLLTDTVAEQRAKQQAEVGRYEQGVSLLDNCSQQVALLQTELTELQPKLVKASRDTDELMESLKLDQKKAEETRKVILFSFISKTFVAAALALAIR